jgi:hypothetical protein
MNDFIPCFGGLGFFALLFGFIAFMRFLSYRETLALAEKGLVKPARSNGNGKGALIWGVIITAVGLAVTLGLWPLGIMFDSRQFPFGFGPWMVVGLVPTFFGVALILVHVLTRESKPKDEENKPSDKPQG